MNHERAVFVGAENLAQETKAGRALFAQDAALADAGVEQQAEGERLSGFLREIADGLRMAILFEGEIVLGR